MILPNTVTTLDQQAFYNCRSLTSLTLSTALSSIGSECFRECKSISGELIYPAGVTVSGHYAFYNCDGITAISFSTRTANFKFSEASFWDCDAITTLNFPSNVYIDLNNYGIFNNCDKLQTINNFNKIKGTIGTRCFSSCTKLNVSSWSTEISTISSEAFTNCYSLTSLPNVTSLLYMYDGAFSSCTKLETNIITYLQNSKIKLIGSNCFRGDSKLTGNWTGTITANLSTETNKTISIGGNAFGGTGVQMAKLLDLTGKTSIADGEYKNVTVLVDSNNNEITEITIPNTVTSIGAEAFAGTNITKVTIPNTVTSLGTGCFFQCSKLTTVELSSNVTTIPTNCFRNCSKLKYINKTTTSDINLNNVTTIEGWSFSGSGIGGNLNLSSVEGALGGAAFYCCYSLTGVTFGNKLTDLGSMTFAENYNMTGALVIPDSVQGAVPSDATFYKCNFTSVTIGSGVTSLCSRMFLNNTNLKTVIVRGALTNIGYDCFINCSSLESISMDWSSLKTIGTEAFQNTSKLKGTANLSYDCNYNIETTFYNCGLTVTQDYVEGDS